MTRCKVPSPSELLVLLSTNILHFARLYQTPAVETVSLHNLTIIHFSLSKVKMSCFVFGDELCISVTCEKHM
jgi:hypothetical protein